MKVPHQKILLYTNIYGFLLILKQKISKKSNFFFLRIFKARLPDSNRPSFHLSE